MRLLLANPNTTEAVTALIAKAARAAAAPGTEIVPVTAGFGARVIGTRTEMAVAEHASASLVASHAAGCDAAIIGASLDSGLGAAREMLGIPALGITEAALHTACLLGGRFGVLALSARSAAVTREMVAAYGLLGRMAGLAWMQAAPQHILADPDGALPALVEAARLLVERDLADVIVLIGAVMAGLPGRMQSAVPVPVLEGVSCAVVLAEGLVRLRPASPAAGSYAAPPPRILDNVDPALQARLGG